LKQKNGQEQPHGKSLLVQCPHCFEFRYARGMKVHLASHLNIDMGQFKKGKSPWNSGLSKENDQRVLKISTSKIGKKLILKEYKCPICERICKGHSALVQHNRHYHIKDLFVWNRGLTKETDIRIAESAIKDSKSCIGRPCHKKSGRGRIGRCIDLDNQFFRSRWEANFARILKFLNISYEYEKYRFYSTNFSYCPDFYLPQFDKFFEIKGYFDEDSIKKIKYAVEGPLKDRLIVLDKDGYSDLGGKYRNVIEEWEK